MSVNENAFYQSVLWKKIKEKLDERHQLAEEVADVLQCSRDSAYRRIRNETLLSLEETVALVKHYSISMVEVTGYSDQAAVFQRHAFINSLEKYEGYMERSLEQLKHIQDHKNHVMYYLAKDIPVFYQFGFEKLCRFKIYVWLKSLYNVQKLNDVNYNLSMIPQRLVDLAKQQWECFTRINTVEIWNDTTISSLLKQIEYYYEAGLLTSREEALDLCDEFQQMMKVIYKQSLDGQKVHAHNTEMLSGASCAVYFHEVLIMDNHILSTFDEHRRAYFIPYGGVNFLSTTNPEITGEMLGYIKQQCSKSALISDVSEKDRNRFFIKIKNRIDQLRDKINTTDPFL